MSTYILVPGMWIGAWAWRDVAGALRDAGHDVYPLTLTGVADRLTNDTAQPIPVFIGAAVAYVALSVPAGWAFNLLEHRVAIKR